MFQKGYWTSSFLEGKSAFLKSGKCFIPPKGACESRSQRAPFDGLSILLCVPERVLGFFVFDGEIRVSEILKTFYCVDGWVGGWMGGDILPLSIFLIFM